MIKLTTLEENKQFISVLNGDTTPTEDIYIHIITLYPNLKKLLYKKDNTEILFELPQENNEKEITYCSFQNLIGAVKEIAPLAETRLIIIENGKRINLFDVSYYELISYFSETENRK